MQQAEVNTILRNKNYRNTTPKITQYRTTANSYASLENPRRGRQARTFTTNVPKILDLKSSSDQILSTNCRWVPLNRAAVTIDYIDPLGTFNLNLRQTA